MMEDAASVKQKWNIIKVNALKAMEETRIK